ncbi:MAG: hypothetical protein U1E28_14050 [Beijerinckiaceae bacterium]
MLIQLVRQYEDRRGEQERRRERSGWLSLFCLLAFATFGWRFIAGA